MKKQYIFLILLALAVGAALGFAASVPKSIQTNSLEILDSKGRPRVRITVDSLDHPVILTLDSVGNMKGMYK
jgi:HAMP domain-containing protein